MTPDPGPLDQVGSLTDRGQTDQVDDAAGRERQLLRRHAAGAPGARSLLLTIMGEFMLPTDGAAWTATLIETLARHGIEPKATRQAIMRTATGGLLRADRVGRRTRWTLTTEAVKLLSEGAERVYGFASADDHWDGHWFVLLAKVPEIDRNIRQALRRRLIWAGFGALGLGVWVSPYPERQAEAEQLMAAAGLGDAHGFVARHTYGDGRRIVRAAWDIGKSAESYASFIERFAVTDPTDPLRDQIDLVHRWRRFPQVAPPLPRSLLPTVWPGEEATSVFRRCHDDWRGPALEAWQSLEHGKRLTTPAIVGRDATGDRPLT